MHRTVRKPALGWYCAFLILSAFFSPFMRCLRAVPELQYARGAGEGLDLSALSLWESCLSVTAMDSRENVTQEVFTGRPLLSTGRKQGEESYQLRLFGVPVKTVSVLYEEERELLLGGECIAISMRMDGALIVGLTQMVDADGTSVYPAARAGLKVGDRLLTINGQGVSGAEDVTREMERYTGQGTMEILYERNGKRFTTTIEPVKDPQDGSFRLGLWIRDAMNGIGTLTYADPRTGSFGALGHGITDPDTGVVLELADGTVTLAREVQAEPSRAGLPGELRGYTGGEEDRIGRLTRNTAYGVFGTVESFAPILRTGERRARIAHASEVHTGDATILCTLEDGSTEEYTIRILRVARQERMQTKGILLEVTDARLLARTGGIIQGMSGSPILQDGRLIGAVTHVLVNDPRRGYGIFLDAMLDAAG